MPARNRAIVLVLVASFLVTGCGGGEPTATPMPPTEPPLPPAAPGPPTSTARPSDTAPLPTVAAAPPATAPPTPTEAPEALDRLLSLISQERLFASLEALTAIQPYSGWRSTATEGEADALGYVAETLRELSYLQDIGR